MNAMSAPTSTAHDAEREEYIAAVATVLEQFLAEKYELLERISPATLVLLDSIRALATGGKRMRALLCYWGWRGAGGAPGAQTIVQAGVALELFQTAALIHDDIIDRSDTRRGGPSVHRRFRTLHQDSNWALEGERFGNAAAILAGDLCLSLSEEMFARITTAPNSRARDVFNIMRTEVMAGQYLDILEEVAGPSKPRETAVARAAAIIRYKSAKYSSEHPLVLGGALAGAAPALLEGYSAFALPLGEAFQVRDDVLGVFGDPAITGKPAGDDLREGKRTVLVGLTMESATEIDRTFMHESLGRPDLTGDDVARLTAMMRNSGALTRAEEMISTLRGEAFAALDQLPLEPAVAVALAALAEAAISRSA